MAVREGDLHNTTEYAPLEVSEQMVRVVEEVVRRQPHRACSHMTVVCQEPGKNGMKDYVKKANLTLFPEILQEQTNYSLNGNIKRHILKYMFTPKYKIFNKIHAIYG